MKRIDLKKAGGLGWVATGAALVLGIAAAPAAVADENSGVGGADRSVEYRRGAAVLRADTDAGRGAPLDVVPGVYLFAAAPPGRSGASATHDNPHAATKPQTGMGAIVPVPQTRAVVAEHTAPTEMQPSSVPAK